MRIAQMPPKKGLIHFKPVHASRQWLIAKCCLRTKRFKNTPLGSVCAVALPQRLLSNGSKLRACLPFWHFGCIRYLVSNQKIELAVLHIAAHVPVGINHIRRLVVVLLRVFVPHHHAPSRWLPDEVRSRIRIERRNAHFGKAEVVGPVVETFLRFRIILDNASLLPSSCGSHFV